MTPIKTHQSNAVAPAARSEPKAHHGVEVIASEYELPSDPSEQRNWQTVYGYSGPLDLDRGLQTCHSPKYQITVNMYLDDPGVYFDSLGRGVSETQAKLAGFDIVANRLARRTLQLPRDVKATVDSIFAEKGIA